MQFCDYGTHKQLVVCCIMCVSTEPSMSLLLSETVQNSMCSMEYQSVLLIHTFNPGHRLVFQGLP